MVRCCRGWTGDPLIRGILKFIIIIIIIIIINVLLLLLFRLNREGLKLLLFTVVARKF